MATEKAFDILVTKTDGNWQIGTINGVQFWAKVYEENSQEGINGGNISKLSIKNTAEYDRGWDEKPKTKLGRDLVNALIEYFADLENCKEKEELKKAVFCRKASNLSDIQWITQRAEGKDLAEPYVIEKTITLTKKEFTEFCNDLLEERDYIKNSDCDMRIDDNDVWHTIAVTCNGSTIMILVDDEGYGYARYTAMVAKEVGNE